MGRRLSAAVLIPAVLLAAGLVVLVLARPPAGTDRTVEAMQQLGRDAAGASQALEAEFRRRLGLLTALAQSPVADAPGADLRALDGHARAIAAELGAPVIIADAATLAELVNTTFPFGTPLPGLVDSPAVLEALESGRSAIAGAADDPLHPVLLTVPVERQGRRVAVLTSAIGRQDLEHILAAQPASATGVALALAASGERIIAAVGAPAGDWPELRRLASGDGGGTPAAPGSGLRAAALGAVEAIPGWQVIAAGALPPVPWRTPAPLLAASAVLCLTGAGLVWLRRRDGAGPPADAAALHSLSEMRRLNDTIPVGLALLDRELCFVSVNARFANIGGLPVAEHINRKPGDVLPPTVAEPIAEACRTVLRTGKPALDIPISGEAPAEIRNERHFLASCHPARDAEQRIAAISVVMQDVTERMRAERTRELLVRELNHRVKNTLATVQSLVFSTLRQASDAPASLRSTLAARLQALARAHDLLTEHDWQETELADVVQAALAPWLHSMPGRILIDGPPGVPLRPRQAQAVMLALHELATNAAKHGALSASKGRVGLVWEAGPEEPVRLRWIETGGPPVVEPPAEKRGFGTRLLERGVAADLGGGAAVRLNFAPQGLRAVISFTASMPPMIDAEWPVQPAATAGLPQAAVPWRGGAPGPHA